MKAKEARMFIRHVPIVCLAALFVHGGGASAGPLGGLELPEPANGAGSCLEDPGEYVARSLSAGGDVAPPALGAPLLRFVQLSDVHVYDDDASPAVNGSSLETALELTIGNSSAQRFQDEYTDEVLNAMIATINDCDRTDEPIALMLATGDNTDTDTLNEVRRYIDNLDGTSGQDTAYEANCGYTIVDSNGNPKLGGAVPCTEDLQAAFVVPTGKLVADSSANSPDPENPLDQLAPTRSLVQDVDTLASSIAGLSSNVAPGLPDVLRCTAGDADCTNRALAVPYFAAFGNHDGAIRGTLTFQAPAQGSTLAQGRYFFESQREWVNEFFHTTPVPGPVGHGFQWAGARLDDADDRNDGYYVFGVVRDGPGWAAVGPDDARYGNAVVRMIVLNTLYDGVRNELHRNGQTNTDTQGLVTGNEVSNPIGLEAGVVPEPQFEWLEGELASAAAAGVPALVFSHHPDRSFTDTRLGFPAEGVTSVQFDELLGRASHDGDPSTLLAHVAGHTHENIIRPCTPGDCIVGGIEPNIERGFWRIETASLVDYPQEGRIVELFALPHGEHALRLTMISPDPDDPFAALSHRLSIAEATCNLSDLLGGTLDSPPVTAEDIQARVEKITESGEAAVQGKFCQEGMSADEILRAAEGGPEDRDVILLP